MSASPAIAPGAGTQPIPGADQAPPETLGPDQAEEDPRRRRRRIALLLLLLSAFIALLGLSIWYLLFRQPINPIPPIPGQAIMPGYVTSVVGSNNPMGVAVTADGSRIFVGETQGDRVAQVFDSGGTKVGLMQPPVSTGEDHVPVYLAMDPLTGEIYVSDRPTGSIYIYDANGTFQRAYTPPAEVKGWQPLGMAFDAVGNLYVTDVSVDPQTVLVLDRAGALVRTIGVGAEMSFPNGVAVDGAGYMYVTDSNNGRLVVFDQQGEIVAKIGRGVGQGNLGLPRGIAVSSDGRVYVVDSTGHAVSVYATYTPGSTSLEYLGSFGSQGVGDGQFEFPNGISLDSRGRIYVADSANDRVQVWSY